MMKIAQGREYTLMEALSEVYHYNPRKKSGSHIVFIITIDENSDEFIKFGKYYSDVEKKFVYFEKTGPNVPTLGCDEKHFVSNLFTNEFAKKHMHYAAQQGKYKVRKLTDISE